MSKTALAGPLMVIGQEGPAFVPPGDYNPNLGPSPIWGGVALLDPRRAQFPSGAATNLTPCWPAGKFLVADFAPADKVTTNTNLYAAAQAPTAGTALTLATTGTGLLFSQTVQDQVSGATDTGLIVVDGLPALIAYGAAGGPVAAYDPATMIGRNVRLKSVGDDSGGTADVIGYDVYGYKIKETITLTNASTASGKKAFKYIKSITPQGTLSGSNISASPGDVLGLPIRADRFCHTQIYVNDALITASTGFVAADTTTATATTGDVRGTYALQTASDGTKRTQIFMSVDPTNLKTTAGFFGVAQFGG